MPASGPERSLLADLDARSSDESFVYQGPDATISWAALDSRSRTAATGLRSMGLQPGDRVALLLPPSAELLVAVAAIWRAGGTLVAADASAGMPQLRRLIRASAPRFVVGNTLTLAVARLCRFAPGARAAAFASIPRAVDLRRMPPDARGQELAPCSDDLAAIVHTSGATGAAKPVRYSHGALAAQREALAGLFEIDRGDAFTTSFGPFMLLAPSLGMGCVRPDFDVNKPSKLDFEALAAAVARARVTTAWLSPASARTIANTAAGRRVPIRLVMLAGAPIPRRLVEELRAVTGGELRAPYGMTECLPVTDGIDPTLRGPLGGTATGHAVSGCEVIIAPLDDPGADALAEGTWGEILVSAPWMFDGYDGRWTADATSEILRGSRRFHRTGDVGYLSGDVLFQLGRLAHVIRAADGPVPSIILEEPISDATSRPVAAVGVGPSGAAVVAVVVSEEAPLRIAPRELAEVVRAAAGRPIAAVLVGRLPLDRRHQSKVDRAALAASVTQLLSGR
jgi:acyl-CoA synthetase (AMP-forming)/AMP-acid ligase II